jgi:glycosyltransferase involved in cell wall biosynthesis
MLTKSIFPNLTQARATGLVITPSIDRDEIELTILMPCLNEALTVASCVNKARDYLQKAGLRGEVVVADNGSTDGSQDLARQAGARVVDVPIRGYGAALIAGINAARGRFVIMGDADDSYDFTRLDDFVATLRDGTDLVMGNRFRGGIAPGAMPPLHKYLGNPVLTGIGRLLFRSPIKDFHCGLRGFNRASILRLGLSCPGMEFASEMVVKSHLHGLRIAEVPTTLSPDGRDRPPHLRSWRDGWRHLRFMLLFSPDWLFFWPGVVLAVLGAFGIAALAGGPVKLPSGTVLDLGTMVYSVAAFAIGLQTALLGRIAHGYAHRAGLWPDYNNRKEQPFEWTVVLGAVLVAAGLSWAAWQATGWSAGGFGPVQSPVFLRQVLVSAACLMSGVELVFMGFFEGLLRIRG